MSLKEDGRLWRTARAEANKQLSAIQERIKAGETTGDKITDFILYCYSGNFEIEPRLRNIESRLQGKTGQLAICIDETKDTDKTASVKFSAYLFRYNKLIGTDLDFNFRGELILPTRNMQMVDCLHWPEEGIFNSNNDVLRLSTKQLASLLGIEDTSRAGRSLNPKVHLLIGDQELMDWLNFVTSKIDDQEMCQCFRSQIALMAHMAGHSLSTLPELKTLLYEE